MHNVGTPLTISAGQGFSGIGSIADPVDCQGTISAATGGSINLNGGVTVSGTGNVNLGGGVSPRTARSRASPPDRSRQPTVTWATTLVGGNIGGQRLGTCSSVTCTWATPEHGTFTQSGGANNVGSGTLFLGYNAGTSGTYNLSGAGSLAAYENVGYSGTATLTQSGGTNNVVNSLCLGYNSGSSGSYNLSGSGCFRSLRIRGLLRHGHVHPVRRNEQPEHRRASAG